MCQQTFVAVPLFPVSLQQQRTVVCIQQILQQGLCLAGKRLAHLAMMPGFRGIDTDKTQPTPVFEFYCITIIDMNNPHAFTAAIGSAATCMDGLDKAAAQQNARQEFCK